jgi:hypothetical protein
MVQCTIRIGGKMDWKGLNLLLPDSWLLDQWLSKHDSLVAPLEAFFDYCPRHANHAAAHHEALVVEVRHCCLLDRPNMKQRN